MKDTIKVDLSKLKNFECTGCKDKYFEFVYELKQLPGILSPDGKKQVMIIQHYRCTHCGQLVNQKDLEI
jgi:DNA-directed RNA polymerase subunit RPC12/RpoP